MPRSSTHAENELIMSCVGPQKQGLDRHSTTVTRQGYGEIRTDLQLPGMRLIPQPQLLLLNGSVPEDVIIRIGRIDCETLKDSRLIAQVASRWRIVKNGLIPSESRCLVSPKPECWRMCGLPTAPPLRMTSLVAVKRCLSPSGLSANSTVRIAAGWACCATPLSRIRVMRVLTSRLAHPGWVFFGILGPDTMRQSCS